jgi:glyoxylase-like metal-dependent hydrolase (beta-lactamase superfamily II)
MTTVLPTFSKLSERVVRILGCNPGMMTLQGTNTYIIGTGKKRILLDAGEPNNQDYLNHLKAFLDIEKLCLSHIIVTHHHMDHLGGVPSILDHLKIRGDCRVFKYARADDPDEGMELHSLKDGDEIHTEGATLKMYHTPGHTEDHLSAVLMEENALFSGDCLLGEGTAVFENLRKLMNSLMFYLELDPSIIYPGHGPVVNNPVEKIKEYIEHRHQREQQILNVIPPEVSKAVSIEDIVRKIYTNVPEKLMKAAAVNVFHHLIKLEEEDVIRCTQTMEGKKFVRVDNLI